MSVFRRSLCCGLVALVVGFVLGIGGADFGAWLGLGRLMDRVLLFLLGMRWKGWYLERALHLVRGATSSKFRVIVGPDQRVTDIAHRYTIWE